MIYMQITEKKKRKKLDNKLAKAILEYSQSMQIRIEIYLKNYSE